MKKLLTIFLCLVLLTGCAETYDGPTGSTRLLTSQEMTMNGQTTRNVMAYDIYGNCVSTEFYTNDKLTSVRECTFDDAGRELTATTIDRTGLFPRKLFQTQTTYDDRGRILTQIYLDSRGKEQERTEYTYDGDTVTKTILPGGLSTVTYLNADGQPLRILRADMDLETLYTYDDRGNQISSATWIGGERSSWMEWEYDDQNRLLRCTVSDPADSYTCSYYEQSMTQTAADGSTRTEYYGEDGQIEFVEGFDAAGNQTMKQIFHYEQIPVALREEETP